MCEKPWRARTSRMIPPLRMLGYRVEPLGNENAICYPVIPRDTKLAVRRDDLKWDEATGSHSREGARYKSSVPSQLRWPLCGDPHWLAFGGGPEVRLDTFFIPEFRASRKNLQPVAPWLHRAALDSTTCDGALLALRRALGAEPTDYI